MATSAPLLHVIAADLGRAGARLTAEPADRIRQRRQTSRRIQCVIAASHPLEGAVRAAPERPWMGSMPHRRRFREAFLPVLSGTTRE